MPKPKIRYRSHKEKIEKVESLAQEFLLKEKEKFEDEHQKVEALAQIIPILVLGDHKGKNCIIDKITKSLEKNHHIGIPLKEVAKKGNNIHSEKVALNMYKVIVKVDGKKPGSIGENLLIVGDKKCQERCILLVNNSIGIWDRLLSIEEYFVYFPKIYLYDNEKDLIRKATKLAIRETYRLVYTHLHKNMVIQADSEHPKFYLNKAKDNNKYGDINDK